MATDTRLARLMAKVRVDENGCWRFTGAHTRDGYGHIGIARSKAAGAHRVSYELHVGPIPAGMELDHLCRVRDCVNPEHLEPVTPKVNRLRGVGIGAQNAQRTTCPQGHAYDFMDKYGRRRCRECVRKANRDYRARQKEKNDA